MKGLSTVIFIVVALAQLGVPASMIWQREQTLAHGRVWKFRTAPVDPVDVVRGRYIALRFAAEEFNSPEKFTANGDSAYAVLKEGADGFAEVDHLSRQPLSGDNVVTAEPRWWEEGKQHIRFPFDQFWVTEAKAPAAEKAYAANSTREKQNAYATVRVRNGDAALEQLYIDNQALPDYLRAHSRR
jgi:uncharacterized membrane-anchored protein